MISSISSWHEKAVCKADYPGAGQWSKTRLLAVHIPEALGQFSWDSYSYPRALTDLAVQNIRAGGPAVIVTGSEIPPTARDFVLGEMGNDLAYGPLIREGPMPEG
ncbi:MAG: hypothetical protein LAO24_23765 [Acidobacteriia bacterium]|nr:hypothetical protein [Terriglobia bacterium]